MKNNNYKVVLTWSLILLVFWIAVSGKVQLHEILLAVVVILFVMHLIYKLITNIFEEPAFSSSKFEKPALLAAYIYYITRDIVTANLHVAKIILSPGIRIKPGMLKYRHGFVKKFTSFLYANSITLTPGTLTIKMDDENIMVHALETENETGLRNWKVEKLLKKLEGNK
jgi:multicomponent Na+:H+ antiporter subunit E